MAGAAPAGSLTFSALPQVLKNVLNPDKEPTPVDIDTIDGLSEDQKALYSLVVALGFTIELDSKVHLIHTIYNLLQLGNDKNRVRCIQGVDLCKILQYIGKEKPDLTITPAMRAFVLMRIAQFLAFQHDEYEIAIKYCDKADELYGQTYISKALIDHNMLRVVNLSIGAFSCHRQNYRRSASIRIERAQDIVDKTQARKSPYRWVLKQIYFMDSVSAVAKS